MTVTRRSAMGTAAASFLSTSAQAAAPPQAGQVPGFFRFWVGEVQVTAISDGTATRAADGYVPNAPAGAVRQALADRFLPTDEVTTKFTTLVLNMGGKLVLIDTGNGDSGPPKTGTWLRNFRAAGFEPGQVDTVVISHFHSDHINGLRMKDGQPRFPQAEVMVPSAEWAFWADEAKASQSPAGVKGVFDNTARVFDPMRADVKRFDWGREILPGLTAIDAHGHTPGHTAFALVSGTGRLMIMSDTTNDPYLFARNPDWSPIVDFDGPDAVVTRKRMLDLAASERMQVSFYHAPFPATGHIVRLGAGYDLVPAVWQSDA